MNEFDKRYDIRIGRKDDIPIVMDFIKRYWNPDHILVKNQEYFEYEFCENDGLNFVLAFNNSTKELEACWGFLKSALEDNVTDVWGSIWKVNSEHNNLPLLGLELIKRSKELIGYRYRNGIGANPHTAIPIIKLFTKSKVAKMKQFYILNPSMPVNEFKIANICKRDNLDSFGEWKVVNSTGLKDVKKLIEVNKYNNIPIKDFAYFERKYIKNPKRSYLIFEIKDINNILEAVLVTRECEAMGEKALRIVDYYGKKRAIGECGPSLIQLMIEKKYEYIDFYTWGFQCEYLTKAGFTLRDECDQNIIPNYFEPFVRENIDIWIHYENDETIFFKADGDQDRANL